MKKSVLVLGTVAIAMVLGACGNSESTQDSSTAKGDQQLIVSTFALSEDIVQRDVIKPFETNHGVSVTLDLGNSADRYTKMTNNKNSGIDVIELAQNHGTQGNKEGVFAKMTDKEVPNISELTEGAKEVFESGAGVPIAVNSIGIVYNEKALGRKITEWEDLWASDLKGKISVPDITTTAGPMMMYVASDYNQTDITKDNGKKAFEAMTALRPNVVKTYTKSSDLANMFQSEEILVAVVADFAVDIIKGASSDVSYVVPESGTYANYNTINVLENAKNKEVAYDFVNDRISKSQQQTKALSLNEGPVNQMVGLTEKEAENITYGDVAKRAKMIDFNFVNEAMDEWINTWNRTMNQ